MRLKKSWNKPALRRLCVADQYDPNDGLTREQWKAARELQRRAAARENEMEASGADADAPP